MSKLPLAEKHDVARATLELGSRNAVRSVEASPEVEALFQRALAGTLPRARDLKPYEPQRLNERHLAMIAARAAGTPQRIIAVAWGVSDANVSVVMNHPDAQFLLSKLGAVRAQAPSGIEERMEKLMSRAMDSLEEVFDEDSDVPVLHRGRLASQLLRDNGFMKGEKQVDPSPQLHIHANVAQLSQLSKALREAQQLPAGPPEALDVTHLAGVSDA